MSEEEAKTCGFNPFDLTKVWSQKVYPLIDVGYFEAMKILKTTFNEIEQARHLAHQISFQESHIV